MRLIDLIKTIETKKNDFNYIDIQCNGGTYLSRVDYTRNKRDSIRIPLEELNIDFIFPLPSFIFTEAILLWVTEDCKYLIIYEYSRSTTDTIILDIKELKEQDESYLLLKYGKLLLTELEET